jgi:transposase
MKTIEIQLEDKEIKFLNEFKKKGIKNAREITRANILLLVNDGMKIKEIAKILGISRDTVTNIKKRYLAEGLEATLHDKPRPGQPRKYDDEKITEIIALACTDPPKGRREWSVRLIAETLSHKEGFETITRETIRLILKKKEQDRGLKKCGV